MIGKILSNFESVSPAPQEFLEAEGGRVLVTVKGVGTTKSGNELTGDSIWLYKVATVRSPTPSSTATPRPRSRHSPSRTDSRPA
jgi:hypothetical protein